MAKVTIEQGMALDIVLARIFRESGLHIIKVQNGIITHHESGIFRESGLHVVKVHNGVITHHGKMERVKNESWVLEEMEGPQKKPRKAKGEPEGET